MPRFVFSKRKYFAPSFGDIRKPLTYILPDAPLRARAGRGQTSVEGTLPPGAPALPRKRSRRWSPGDHGALSRAASRSAGERRRFRRGCVLPRPTLAQATGSLARTIGIGNAASV